MSDFLQSVIEYKYLWGILLVLIALAVFMWVKASKALKLHNQKFQADLQKAERNKMLFDRYSGCNLAEISDDAADDIIEGFAIIAEKNMDDATDLNAAFVCLSTNEKYAYAAKYFFEDSEEGTSKFFRGSTHPLTDTFMAVVQLADKNAYDILVPVYEMTDENNENVSFDEALLKKYDEMYRSTIDTPTLKNKIKAVIIQNGN